MIGSLALLLAVLAAISLFIGDATLALPDGLILWQLRVPRTLLAALVGGGLGLSGAVLQGALRNPLADPGLRRRGSLCRSGARWCVVAGRWRGHVPAGADGRWPDRGGDRRCLPAGLCGTIAIRAFAHSGWRRGIGDRRGRSGSAGQTVAAAESINRWWCPVFGFRCRPAQAHVHKTEINRRVLRNGLAVL